MSLAAPARRMQRVRHEPLRREVEVLRAERIGANFVSVTFHGESLAGFASASFQDHVKFILDDGAADPVKRDYTPRHFDPERRELIIDFVLHGGGEAGEWARRAQPGMAAVIGGPKSSLVIPTDYDWHLLVGDATALPAIHRRIEELPARTRIFALIQVDDTSDRRAFACAAPLDITWLSPRDDLAAHVRTLSLPDSEGFAWCAGEAASMARVRDALVERRHAHDAMRVAAYWKKGAGGFHETLET